MRHFFKINWLFGFLILADACQEALPESRAFPVIRTLAPKDVDSSGATFQAQLITGKNSTTAYGFIWDIAEPEIATANKIELGTAVPEGVFEKRIESMLAKDAEYKVRAYATLDGKTIYGSTVTFKSEGSKQSGWSLETQLADVTGGFSSFGGTDSKFGYILYQLSQAYKYDPEKKSIAKIQDLPFAGDSGVKFTTCSHNGALYIFEYKTNNLTKLVNDIWSVVSPLPFNYGNFGGYYHAFSANGYIYILSSYKSYAYDVTNDLWYPLPTPNVSTGSTSGVFDGANGYLLMYDKTFWEFNVTTNQWIQRKDYPGNSTKPLVTFANNSKMYVGLSEDTDFWSYDASLNEWEVAEKFPTSLEDFGIQFFFVVKDKLYYGVSKGLGDFSVWSFEEKIF